MSTQDPKTIRAALRDYFQAEATSVRKAYSSHKLKGVLAVLRSILSTIILFIGCVVICAYYTPYTLVKVLGILARRTAGHLHQAYKKFMHRHFDNVGLGGGLLVVIGLSYGLYLLDPRTPTLSLATVQVLATMPVLLFLVLHVATFIYKHLLPEQFRAFVGQLGEKLNTPVLPPLDSLLQSWYSSPVLTLEQGLAVARFKVLYAVVTFALRAARFLLYGLVYLLLVHYAHSLLVLVLNMPPH